MEGSVGLLLVLLTLAIIHIVQAQDQLGIRHMSSMYIIHIVQASFLFFYKRFGSQKVFMSVNENLLRTKTFVKE